MQEAVAPSRFWSSEEGNEDGAGNSGSAGWEGSHFVLT
jgi:hypothetical protein